MDPPYAELERVRALAHEAHPDNTGISRVWTPKGEHECYAMVWHAGHGKLWRPAP